MPTGWRPADVNERYPLPRCLPQTQQKFNPSIPVALSAAVLAVHVVLVLVMVAFQLLVPVDNFSQALVHFIPLGAVLWLNGRILEGRPDAAIHSAAFWGLCALLPWWFDGWLLSPLISSAAFIVAGFLILISARQRAVAASDVVSSISNTETESR
jgi:hypothetical protein